MSDEDRRDVQSGDDPDVLVEVPLTEVGGGQRHRVVTKRQDQGQVDSWSADVQAGSEAR